MRYLRWLVFFLICSFSAIAWSQSITGSIRGTVTDTEGQPIAGVTVIVRGNALIGQRESTTNAEGIFRFPSLPVGIYSIECTLSGLATISRNNIVVTVGGTEDAPLVFRLVKKNETIEVNDQPPLIDRYNSGFSTTYQQEMIQNLPIQRNMWVLMQVAPGITTDLGDSRSAEATIAFGSNRQSNSWIIDGIDASTPDSGTPFVQANPDIIQQIQIYGVGAPAEYGNHSGAVFNVITKDGGNTLHGSLNTFFQTEKLTGVNVRLPDSDFVFHRDKFYDISAQAGGPIRKDKVWFFAAMETRRDEATPPGVDPNEGALFREDKYDAKISAHLSDRSDLKALFHDEPYDIPDGAAFFIAPSALGHHFGTNPTVSTTLTSSINNQLLLEANYSFWWGNQIYDSEDGNLEDPIFDFTGNPIIYGGGTNGAYDYSLYRHQGSAKATYYADHFLKAQHEFKFGTQYSYGSAAEIYSFGANGRYIYRANWGTIVSEQAPFIYGGTSSNLGTYIDDSAEVNSRLTLNLGLRFDHNSGSIPEYDRLEVGTPSITQAGNFKSTGIKIPGVDDYVHWNLFSPRLGFVWRTREDGRAALRGSFGVYYEGDIMGNWYFPAPDTPPVIWHFFDVPGLPQNYTIVNPPYVVPRNNHLKPPRSLQYSLGYEFQPTDNSSIDVLYVYKDTTDLIGWEILGGQWYPISFWDPVTGQQYNSFFPFLTSPPTIQKGNSPGDFPGSKGLRYFQNYSGLVLTFTKRFSNAWALSTSYTRSRSYGLIPRMLSQAQFGTFFNSSEGNNVLNYINSKGHLQGDRPNMFRAQVLFSRLPWNLDVASSIEFSDGNPYSREARIHLEQDATWTNVLMESPGSRRHAPIRNIDLSIGRNVNIDNRFRLRLEGQILNLLNSAQELRFATLILWSPDQTFSPSSWVQPRRLQVHIGLQF